MDAANVDLKGFTEDFYQKVTGGHLSTVLATLVHLRHETTVWFEITTLLIPGHNDSSEEIGAMARWVVEELGPDVPHHFTAFHPDWRMTHVPATPLATLARARDIALDAGEHFVYTGNVHHTEGGTTFCPGCGLDLIVRDWYRIDAYRLTPDGACPRCRRPVQGVFADEPGDFGPHRIPVRLST